MQVTVCSSRLISPEYWGASWCDALLLDKALRRSATIQTWCLMNLSMFRDCFRFQGFQIRSITVNDIYDQLVNWIFPLSTTSTYRSARKLVKRPCGAMNVLPDVSTAFHMRVHGSWIWSMAQSISGPVDFDGIFNSSYQGFPPVLNWQAPQPISAQH